MMMADVEEVTPVNPVIICNCDSANGVCKCFDSSNQIQRKQRKMMQWQQAPAAPERGRKEERSRQINRLRSFICKNLNKEDSMTQPVLTQWSDLFTRRRARSVDSPRVIPQGAEAAPNLSLLSSSPTTDLGEHV